jgi:hypothetical protein
MATVDERIGGRDIVSHGPNFSRGAAFQGSMAVWDVQAQSVFCLSLKLRVRVSFTVETTVPPSDARGDGSEAS